MVEITRGLITSWLNNSLSIDPSEELVQKLFFTTTLPLRPNRPVGYILSEDQDLKLYLSNGLSYEQQILFRLHLPFHYLHGDIDEGFQSFFYEHRTRDLLPPGQRLMEKRVDRQVRKFIGKSLKKPIHPDIKKVLLNVRELAFLKPGPSLLLSPATLL